MPEEDETDMLESMIDDDEDSESVDGDESDYTKKRKKAISKYEKKILSKVE